MYDELFRNYFPRENPLSYSPGRVDEYFKLNSGDTWRCKCDDFSGSSRKYRNKI